MHNSLFLQCPKHQQTASVSVSVKPDIKSIKCLWTSIHFVRRNPVGASALGLQPKGFRVFCLVAAALLHHHVLVMPHDHLAVLEVQHGHRCQARWHAGKARHLVWVVKFQEALDGERDKLLLLISY